eukprot:1150539-Pelagomonas_calceolata.AAC.6
MDISFLPVLCFFHVVSHAANGICSLPDGALLIILTSGVFGNHPIPCIVVFGEVPVMGRKLRFFLLVRFTPGQHGLPSAPHALKLDGEAKRASMFGSLAGGGQHGLTSKATL